MQFDISTGGVVHLSLVPGGYEFLYPRGIQQILFESRVHSGSFASFKKIYMKPHIIKLNLAGTITHVNSNQILYYYPKQTETGQIVTVMYLAKDWGIEVADTPAEIDAMISAGRTAL